MHELMPQLANHAAALLAPACLTSMVTRFPNHECATSCTTVLAARCFTSADDCAGSMSSIVTRNVKAPPETQQQHGAQLVSTGVRAARGALSLACAPCAAHSSPWLRSRSP